MYSTVRFLWPAIAPSVILLLIAFTAIMFGSGNVNQSVTEMMVRVVVVVGIYVFVGNSGILSYAGIGFMAIGAYASAWTTCCTLPMVKALYMSGLPDFLKTTSYPFPVGLFTAAALTGLAAAGTGFVILRLSGVAASIATFAFMAIVYAVYINWDPITGGSSSISNIPVYVGPAIASGFAVFAVIIAFAYQTSRFGLMLRATREDAVAARASGIRLLYVRMVAFMLSGALIGLGGALYANFLGILTVDAFYLSATFLTLAMLVIGGVSSLGGAVVGVIVVTLVTELLRAVENGLDVGSVTLQMPHGFQEVGLGIVMILILIFRPGGLTNGHELSLPFGRRKIRNRARDVV